VHFGIPTAYIGIFSDHFLNEALFLEVDVGTAFKYFGSQVLIEVDGISLTSDKYNVSHPDVFF